MPLGSFRLNGIGKLSGPTGRTAKIITATNTTVSTAQSKFGGASAYGTGSGVLSMPTAADLSFGTGPFTVEGWFRFATTNTDMGLFSGPAQTSSLDIARLSDATFRVGRTNTAWDASVASGISINTWYHFAVCRSGSTLRIFRNGTQIYSGTNTNDYFIANTAYVGNIFNGYFDEIRVSKSARYTANFTAPTSAFVNDANTVLLIHANGTNGSTTFTDDNS